MLTIQTSDAGRGATWLLEGFSYFTKAPGAWLGIVAILFILSIVVSLVPLGNLVLQLIMPVFTGGLILGCREIDKGNAFGVNYLFEGFSKNTSQLVIIGVINLILIVILTVLMVVMAYSLIGKEVINALMSGDANAIENIQFNVENVLLVILVGMALYVPIIMLLWFAPTLVVLENQSAIDAMIASFKGCLKNIIPFLIYGIVGFVLIIVASIPLMLGWFVLAPMVVASIYIAYKDIFQSAGSEA